MKEHPSARGGDKGRGGYDDYTGSDDGFLAVLDSRPLTPCPLFFSVSANETYLVQTLTVT